MQHGLAFGVLAVVVAAGVASAAGPAATVPAATGPAATEPAATATGTATGAGNDTAELPPGLAADGVTDPLALARAHDRVLRNASYVVTDASTHRYRNGTLLGTWSSTTAVAADGEFARRNYGTFRNGSGPFAVTHYERQVWSNGSVTLVAQRYGGEAVEYERHDGQATRRQRPDTRWETVYATFSAVNTTVVGEVERDGTTLYRVVATGVRPDSAYDDDRPFDLTALVDERGVVHRLSVSHPTTYEGEPSFVTQTMRVTDVGNATVERPPWHDAALGNATEGRN